MPLLPKPCHLGLFARLRHFSNACVDGPVACAGGSVACAGGSVACVGGFVARVGGRAREVNQMIELPEASGPDDLMVDLGDIRAQPGG